MSDSDSSDQQTLDDVQIKFKNSVGHMPHTAQQMLCFCKQTNLKWKFRDINKWWPNRPKTRVKFQIYKDDNAFAIKYKKHKLFGSQIASDNPGFDDDYLFADKQLIFLKTRYGLAKYDIGTDQWDVFSIDGNETRAVYNHDKNQIYVFCTVKSHQSTQCKIYDLESQKCPETITFNHALFPHYWTETNLVYIPNPIGEPHLIYNNMHCKVDFENKMLITLAHIDEYTYQNATRVIYAETLHQMIWCCGNKIQICDIEISVKQNDYKWQVMDIETPFNVESKGYDVILVLYYIVIVFVYNETNEHSIWFLNLLTKKWIKSQYVLPKIVNNALELDRLWTQCVVLNENIHFIRRATFYEGNEKHYHYQDGYHVSICIDHIIPSNIKDHYMSLFCKYLGDGITILHDILGLIVMYYFDQN